MAYYAFLDDNNVVTEVIAGRDEDDLAEGVTSWEDYYGSFRGQRCLRTSYNTVGNVHAEGGQAFRGNYAGVGFTYDEERDIFIPPQPFLSWIFDEDTCSWMAPVPMPEGGGEYRWDEEAGDWVTADEAV